MKIAVGADHAGYAVKEFLKKNFPEIEWLDQGTNSTDSVDYPDYAERVGEKVASGQATFGVLVCGTGIGMAIAANKVPGVRAANIDNELAARLSRLHNDLNVLCLGARIVAPEYAGQILKVWLETEFDDEGRHVHRVKKIKHLEKLHGAK